MASEGPTTDNKFIDRYYGFKLIDEIQTLATDDEILNKCSDVKQLGTLGEI